MAANYSYTPTTNLINSAPIEHLNDQQLLMQQMNLVHLVDFVGTYRQEMGQIRV